MKRKDIAVVLSTFVAILFLVVFYTGIIVLATSYPITFTILFLSGLSATVFILYTEDV